MEETSKTKVMSSTGAQLSNNESLPKPGTLKGEEVESAKAEMSQVREENTRLKMMLQKIENEYKTLKMLVEDNNFQPENTTIGGGIGNNEVVSSVEEPEHELVSLCLGTNRNLSKNKEENIGEILKKKNGNIGLKLGLDNYDDKSKYKAVFPNLNSIHDNGLLSTENKEDVGGEKWVSNKGLKTIRNGDHEDEVSQGNNVKRARVSVRARCSTPTMNDGCQWRKYGQKIAKSNPCPRAYYRCTVAASCPVRKQVQRCAEDKSILVTTYEGTHNHPLPLSATAMASTTSAAASMLLSGSSSSPPQGLIPTAAAAASVPNTFHGYNINMSNNNSNTHPLYMSNPSSSPPFPTITLDLTVPPSTTSSPFNIASATNFQSNGHGLFPFTGFGFSNPYSNVLGNLDYGTTPFSNRTQNIGSLFQSPMQKRPELMSAAAAASSSQQVLTETLTRAITSDPNFRSVIAAAISKMNGGSVSSVHQANSTVESLGRNLKWDVDQEKSPVRIPSPPAHQAI